MPIIRRHEFARDGRLVNKQTHLGAIFKANPRINQTMECWPLGRPHGALFAAGLLANFPVEADGEAQR